ncbi:MAG TPA: GxxExxY protein [Bacteroidales bacterium]|nr:GxxExxY protein [Bacteroidales bacterium]
MATHNQILLSHGSVDKAVINLKDVHLAQAKNYLAAHDKPLGLLIKFGVTSLQLTKFSTLSTTPLLQIMIQKMNKSEFFPPQPSKKPLLGQY